MGDNEKQHFMVEWLKKDRSFAIWNESIVCFAPFALLLFAVIHSGYDKKERENQQQNSFK